MEPLIGKLLEDILKKATAAGEHNLPHTAAAGLGGQMSYPPL